MSERNQSNHYCVRCGGKCRFSRFQSHKASGKLVFYCLATNKFHNWRVKIIITKEITLKQSNRPIQNDCYSLADMKCPICGKKLQFDKKASYIGGGKYVGGCFNSHRYEIKIVSRLVKEPDCDEIIQIIIKDWKY